MSSCRLHGLGLITLLLAACGGDGDQTGQTGQTGFETSNCLDGQCLGDLVCVANFCVDPGNATSPPVTTVPDPTDVSTTTPTSVDPSATDPSGDPSGNPSTDPSGDPSTDPTVTASATTEPADPSTTNVSDSDPMTSTTLPPDDTTSTTAPPVECKQFDAFPRKSSVMLLLDKSGTMTSNSVGLWDHDNNPNTPTVYRWKSLYTVLSAVLPMYDGKVDLGAGLFGAKTATSNYDPSACVVEEVPEAPLAPDNAATIMAALPAAGAIVKGGSPTAAGFTTVASHLVDVPDDRPRAVVLISDGPANCSADAFNNTELFEVYDDTIHEDVSLLWSSEGIATYVVGIDLQNATSNASKDGTPDNVNSYEKFNQLAVQGGRPRAGDPKFYQTHNELDLTTALTTILEDVQSCVLPLDDVAVDPTSATVKVGGKTYAYTPALNCASGSGWLYTDASQSEVQLCGAACTALKAAGSAEVSLDCP